MAGLVKEFRSDVKRLAETIRSVPMASATGSEVPSTGIGDPRFCEPRDRSVVSSRPEPSSAARVHTNAIPDLGKIHPSRSTRMVLISGAAVGGRSTRLGRTDGTRSSTLTLAMPQSA